LQQFGESLLAVRAKELGGIIEHAEEMARAS